MPAVGWFIASFVMAMGTPGGSIVITNSGPGKWYLFGGAVVRPGRGDRRVRDVAPEDQPVTPVDDAAFRRAAGQFPAGIVVVSTSLHGNEPRDDRECLYFGFPGATAGSVLRGEDRPVS